LVTDIFPYRECWRAQSVAGLRIMRADATKGVSDPRLEVANVNERANGVALGDQ
jgi:hypothetical protein